MTSNDDKTVNAQRTEPQTHVCPACGTENALEHLQKRDYRCKQCGLELAHVDYAPNGTVRSIFGWLRATGEVVLDRYQIKSVLGKGGFGAAYLADDLQLSSKLRVLKEVPLLLFDEYETSLLSKLDHPGIPDIIDRKTVNGMVYLVLKFGGSRTLGSERKQYPNRRLPQDKLFPWMRQLCDVLIYLHGQSPPVVHRDLKPDNILLNEDDRIMLIDFGIAKEASYDGRTRTIVLAGTVAFSPPEQVMGTGTDARADVYALGATFYALLTGQNPTPAHERIAGVALTPPSQLVPDVPFQVEEAIVKSLNLNMNERQQSVKEFLLALSGVDAMEQSRPISSEEWTQRTVVMDRSTENASSRLASLELPTGHTAGGTGAMYNESVSEGVSNPILPRRLPEQFPPPWARTWGENVFGLFAELHCQGLSQRFRWILPGSFFMGSPPGEPEREPWTDSKETWHLVTLSKGFWLADTACTQGLWQAVTGENPSSFNDDPRKPVENVSWLEVRQFIDTLNRQTAGLNAHLPSEAEWEYACRAGTETPFSFGDNISPRQVNYDGNFPYAGGEKGEIRQTTVAVKSLPANAWGLYEMHGNVWEWCRDGWQADLGSKDVADPLFDPPDQDVDRVLRGGSWFSNGRYLRSAIRLRYQPVSRRSHIGFRLALG